MHTVFTHNNARDYILVVDDANKVLNAFDVDQATLSAYLKDGADADLWDIAPHFEDNNPTTIDAYGAECGRDGQLCEERHEFFKVA
jgi:hypothetical protein